MKILVSKEVDFDESELVDMIHSHFKNESKDEIMEYLESMSGEEWLNSAIYKILNNYDVDITEDALFDIIDYLESNI